MRHPNHPIFVFRQDGFSILEVLIAAAIISASALGLGSAISHLSASRKKTQIVSQTIALEAALVTGLQDPANYLNLPVATSLAAGNLPATEPTIVVTTNASANPVESFSIVPGGPAVKLKQDMTVCASPCANTDWTVQAQVSQMFKDPASGNFSYAYQIYSNSAFANIAMIGAPSLATPPLATFGVVIPTTSYKTTDQTQCPAGALAMTGLNIGEAYCLYGSQQKCPPKTIAKGFQLVKYLGDPSGQSYSIELNCSPIKTISCPTQVMSGGVPSGNMASNAYALRSFVPNTLDPNNANAGGSGSAPVGSCLFVGANSSTQRTPATPTADGVGIVSGACPSHYHVRQPATCTLTADAPPAAKTCSDGQTINPVAPSYQLSYPTGGVLCQVVVTRVICGSDPATYVQQSGKVAISYYCDVDANVDQTTPAY